MLRRARCLQELPQVTSAAGTVAAAAEGGVHDRQPPSNDQNGRRPRRRGPHHGLPGRQRLGAGECRCPGEGACGDQGTQLRSQLGRPRPGDQPHQRRGAGDPGVGEPAGLGAVLRRADPRCQRRPRREPHPVAAHARPRPGRAGPADRVGGDPPGGRRAAGLGARRGPAAGHAGGDGPAHRARRPPRRGRTAELRQLRQRRRSRRGGAAPAGQRTAAGRHDHRSAGHGRGPQQARRLARRARGCGRSCQGTPRRGRGLHRGGRRERHAFAS